LFRGVFTARLPCWSPWPAAADSNFATIFIVDLTEVPLGLG
jgi:hypothetical protein